MIVVANLIVMFCTLTGLSFTASISTTSFGLKLTSVLLQSFLITLAVMQCILYLKGYIDYRLNQIEVKKSVKFA